LAVDRVKGEERLHLKTGQPVLSVDRSKDFGAEEADMKGRRSRPPNGPALCVCSKLLGVLDIRETFEMLLL
jgi:hypothetical protein